MSNWRKVRLGDVVTLHYGKGLQTAKRLNGNIPVFSSAGITGFHNEPLVDSGGIIVGRKGTIGTVFYSPGPFFCIDTAYYILPDKSYDDKYLYYLLKTLKLDRLNEDSAVPGLNRETAYSQQFSLPPLPVQRVIAATISCFDDKIELNNRINANLEAQAQAIFKSWFVDFEPFQGGDFVNSELGKIPKGWRAGRLTDIADFLNGSAMQKHRPSKVENGIPVLKIRELRQGICDTNSELCSENVDDLYIVNDGDVVFSWSGSLLVDIWCGGRCGLNQHLFKVTSQEYDKWYYFLWINYHLNDFISIAEDKATTMGHIKREHLEKSLVLIPDDTSYDKISSLMQPIISAIIANKVQTRVLVAIRDTLLPKLMSGEIEVEE
jgi:type I restriction enzyme S subunit